MIGETLGGYRITRKLGEGGMGEVYEAEHIFLGRRAAIKCLLRELSSNAEAVGRFFIEAKTAAMLNHPGLVDIYDQGHTGEGPESRVFIIMEYLDGEDLGTLLRRDTKVSPKMAVAITRQVASALAAVHAKGIVHRDLKPDNLFMVKNHGHPSAFRVKVLDFGIAKLTGPENKDLSVKTRTGSVLGTPSYMSPEQCRGHGKIDWRSDIYSLGCILHEMLTGHPPFKGSGYGEVLAQHIYEPPPHLRTIDPTIPEALEQLVLRTLVKTPDQRLQTMEELSAQLDGLFGAPSMFSMQGVGGSTPPAGGVYDSGALPSGSPVQPGSASMPAVAPASSTPPTASSEQPTQRTTTLRGTASEMVVAPDGAAPKKKRSMAMPLTLAAAAAVVVGVVAFVAVGGGSSASPPVAASPAPVEGAPQPDPQPPAPEPVKPEPPTPEPAAPEPTPPVAAIPAPEPVKPEPVKPDPTPEVAVATPPPVVAVKPPEAVKPEPIKPPEPVKPPEPAKIKLQIASEPAGAELFRADGTRVGKTPFTQELAPQAGKLSYVVRLKGYKDGRVELAGDKSGQTTVKLTQEPKIVTAPPPPTPVAATQAKPTQAKPTQAKPTGKKAKPVKDGVVNPFR